MSSSAAKAAAKLNELRKHPENRLCANCDTRDKFSGFSNICEKFNTFVCSMCKSAHQSFSHRVKVNSHDYLVFLFLFSFVF